MMPNIPNHVFMGVTTHPTGGGGRSGQGEGAGVDEMVPHGPHTPVQAGQPVNGLRKRAGGPPAPPGGVRHPLPINGGYGGKVFR